jgi:hypothetical protein
MTGVRGAFTCGLAVAALLAAALAHAHGGGAHTGFQAAVSYIEPAHPGLLVRVLGGHERLSVANLTDKDVVILDERGQPFVRLAAGRTEVWAEPRIGATEEPPEREGLVRNWEIRGTADGEPFTIVGFLGYRAPTEEAAAEMAGEGLPTWAVVVAGAAGAVVLAAALAVPLLRRSGT